MVNEHTNSPKADRGRSRIKSSNQADTMKKALEQAKTKPAGIRVKNAGRQQLNQEKLIWSDQRKILKDTVTVQPETRHAPVFRTAVFNAGKTYISGSTQNDIKPETEAASGTTAMLRQKKAYQKQKNIQNLQKKKNNFHRKYPEERLKKEPGIRPRGSSDRQQTAVINSGISEMKAKLHIQTETDTGNNIQRSFGQDVSRREAITERLAENNSENRIKASRIAKGTAQYYRIRGKDSWKERRLEKTEKKSGQDETSSKFAKNKKRAKKKFRKAYAAARLAEQQVSGREKGEGDKHVLSALRVMDYQIKH